MERVETDRDASARGSLMNGSVESRSDIERWGPIRVGKYILKDKYILGKGATCVVYPGYEIRN